VFDNQFIPAIYRKEEAKLQEPNLYQTPEELIKQKRYVDKLKGWKVGTMILI